MVAIALILSSVFLPVAFMGGIQGRLNQQFARHHRHLGADLGVQRAVASRRRSRRCCCARARRRRGPLARFFGVFNRGFDKATRTAIVSISGFLIRKAVLAVADPRAASSLLAGGLGKTVPDRLPAGRGPGLLLPQRAAPGRRVAPADGRRLPQGRGDPGRRPRGCKYYNTVAGFSLLSVRVGVLHRLLLRLARSVGRAGGHGLHGRAISDKLNGAFRAQIPEATAFAFPPPAIPGLGTAGGFSFWLQDRSGGTRRVPRTRTSRSSWRRRASGRSCRTSTARSAPRCRRCSSTSTATRRSSRACRSPTSTRRCRRSSAASSSTSSTASAASGASSCRPRRRSGVNAGGHRPVLRAQQRRQHGAALGADHGPPHRRARSTRSASTSSAPPRSPAPRRPATARGRRMDALEEVAAQTLPREMGYDWSDLSYQEKKAAGTRGRGLRAVARLRLPDPRRALRELVAAVQRAALGAGRGVRRLPRAAAAASSTSTSTGRSGWSC